MLHGKGNTSPHHHGFSDLSHDFRTAARALLRQREAIGLLVDKHIGHPRPVAPGSFVQLLSLERRQSRRERLDSAGRSREIRPHLRSDDRPARRSGDRLEVRLAIPREGSRHADRSCVSGAGGQRSIAERTRGPSPFANGHVSESRASPLHGHERRVVAARVHDEPLPGPRSVDCRIHLPVAVEVRRHRLVR
jgi:hypothetical protein